MSTKVFKTDSDYQTSITFYDFDQRKCGIVSTDLGKVSTPDRTFAFTDYINAIVWNLNNTNALDEIPDWAYYYSVNITRCLRTRFFLQLMARNCSYAKKQQDGTYTFTDSVYSNTLNAIGIDISTLISIKQGYTFTDGDIVKLYIGATVYSLYIIGQQGTWIIAELQNAGTLNAGTPALFEIYTPYKQIVNEPAYEVGQMFVVNNPTTISRSYSTLTGSIQGDVYLVDRKGINFMLYKLAAGNITAGFYTLGITFNSQTFPNANILTGNSTYQNLVGFDFTTNDTRWNLKTLTGGPYNFNISCIVNYTPNTNTSYALYVQLSDGTVIYMVEPTTITSGTRKTFSVNVSFDMPNNTRGFIIGENDSGTNGSYEMTDLVISVGSDSVTYKAEAMSPNDKFYLNWNTDAGSAGRINIVDPIGKVTLEKKICFSNTFVPDTKTNGLSSFDPLNTQDTFEENGAIRKLQLSNKQQQEDGSVMLAICEGGPISIYLGETRLISNTGNAFLAQSVGVIGTLNALKGNFGTLNPESVYEYLGEVQWFDATNGAWVRYANNGVIPVSGYKLRQFFQRYAKKYLKDGKDAIKARNGFSSVVSCIDPFNKEMLITLPATEDPGYCGQLPGYETRPPYTSSLDNRYNFYDGKAKTVSFKITKDRWCPAYEFMPDYMEYMGMNLFAFKNGVLYQHEADPVEFNKFYGTYYPGRICFVSNENPLSIRTIQSIGLQANAAPTFMHLLSDQPFVQSSDLVKGDFKAEEGVLTARVRKDRLSPNTAGTPEDRLISGDPMRAETPKIMMEFAVFDKLLKINFVNVGYRLSAGQKL